MIEGANPRHEHEWQVWEDVKLPKDVVLIPGVISHATNIVEHPELVAASASCGSPSWSAARTSSPDRLRLRAGAVLPARPPDHHVGEAPGAGRRREARHQGAVGEEEGGEEKGPGKSQTFVAAGPETQARGLVDQRLRLAAGRFASVFFTQSTSTPAISSLFFSSIIMWPLPRRPASSSRRNVTGTPACGR